MNVTPDYIPENKFLRQVANYYIDKEIDLSGITFVFPNRRSAMFMRLYMQQRMRKPSFLPKMISVTYFTQQFDDSTLASDTELVMILYNEYCKVLKAHGKESQIPDFDNFYFWGSILLNDFNDVDAYMADAHQLFSNLKDVREIKSNYLTPEQIEVIEHLWGKNAVNSDMESFWQHMPSVKGEDSPADKFLNLWEILDELYSGFRKKLNSSTPPLAYSGLQSKRACKKIMNARLEDFRGRHYAFVGFNVLSTSRSLIFLKLKNLGIADFFWDTASPYLRDDKGNPTNAGSVILPLSKSFPSPSDFVLEQITDYADISIIAVPSSTGQTKLAAEILEGWAKKWCEIDGTENVSHARLIDTAIVLPDDHLLMPMLYSVPPKIGTINVTMGIGYSSTPFAALMSAIISMHLRAYKIGESFHYYYQDVTDILSHPHINLILPVQATALRDRIITDHLYNISADEILDEYPECAFIFSPVNDTKNIREVRKYIDTLVSTLKIKLNEKIGIVDGIRYYELEILDGYTEVVNDLCALLEQYKIGLTEHTFLQIIERTIASIPVNFAGEPLKGLQLMGVMDTRALDFSNIIMMSLNERVFPKRNYSPSLIPANLRAGYYLPTQEQEEASYAYQFFRLLGRAKNVRLIYDSRTSGISSGEMSRYLSQLLYLEKDKKIALKTVDFKAEIGEVESLVVNKTAHVIQDLRRFRPGGDLKLSASALKTYLSCPLKFYLEYVKGLRINEDVPGYIDAASYGTVTHRVVQDIYMPYLNKRVTEDVLKIMLNDNLEERARLVLDEIYYKGRYKGRMENFPGEGRVTAKIIAEYVSSMIKSEMKIAKTSPHIFLGAEVGEHKKHEWIINDKYTINYTMSIDRIDSLGDSSDFAETSLIFIDYKTGSDKLSASSVESLFTDSACGGMFQLLVYSHAYAAIFGHRGNIKPMIYKFQTMAIEGIKDLTLFKTPLNDYRLADDPPKEEIGFYQRFEELINCIFEENNDFPFAQTEDINHCTYCQFKQICGRYPEDTSY